MNPIPSSANRLRLMGGALVVGAGVFSAAGAVHAQGTDGATAVLRDTSGRTVGTALFSGTATGVRITLTANGLPAGPHGIHIHAVGQCEAPEFTSAGGHFNPTGHQHGLRNPQGPHAGDLPNLTAAANGTASYSATNAMVTLGAGANSLFDADGSALVIHASADDEVTDPTGNSGGRIACGTIVRGASALPATGSAAGIGVPVTAAGAAGVAGTLALVSAAFMAAMRRRQSR